MKRNIVRGVVAAALVLGVGAQRGWAWGREGHRLTALVAEHYLTPETLAAVKELLGKDSMADISSWADDYRRDHPETGKWHYTDTPSADAAYSRDRDCPVPVPGPNVTIDPNSPWRDCVVDRILYFELRLSDKSLTRDQRFEALKYLVHFIGDIHQPFHVLGDARGGNDYAVTFMGSPLCGSYKCNLHGIWDNEMIDHHNLKESKYVAFLLADIQEHDWEKLAGGTPVQWANVSHRYAVNALAPNGALITKQYYEEEIRVIDSELALGGLRLARVLNTILGGKAVPPNPVEPTEPKRIPMPKPADLPVPATTPTASKQ